MRAGLLLDGSIPTPYSQCQSRANSGRVATHYRLNWQGTASSIGTNWWLWPTRQRWKPRHRRTAPPGLQRIKRLGPEPFLRGSDRPGTAQRCRSASALDILHRAREKPQVSIEIWGAESLVLKSDKCVPFTRYCQVCSKGYALD